MAEHTHLDQQVRTRGECPGCDEFWARQDVRLAGKVSIRQAEQQLERISQPKPIPGKWCKATRDVTVATDHTAKFHTCEKRAGHKDQHHCPLCEIDW
jgi:hypothetical protein